MTDVPIPNVEAVLRRELPEPPQLHERGGAIRYTGFTGRDKCADCQELIYRDMMASRPPNPAVANYARYIRTRNSDKRLLCIEHTQMRKLAEG
jgi:hypothetical protein